MTYFDDKLYQQLEEHVGHDVCFKQHQDEQSGGYLHCAKCDKRPLFEFDGPLSDRQWAGLTSDGLRIVSHHGENIAVAAGHEVFLDVEPEACHPKNIKPSSVAESPETSHAGGE